MKETLHRCCRQALASPSNPAPLEQIQALLQKHPDALHMLWEFPEFSLVILQIFTESFRPLASEGLPEDMSHRITVCLNILKDFVALPEAKEFFLTAQLDYYIYPFILMPTSETLRTATVQLFCAILQGGIPESMRSSELLPLLLKVVDSSAKELQMLSLEALELIMQGSGLDYAVQTLDRFQAMDVVLSALMSRAIFSGNVVLLKRLFRIYIRLCDKSNVKQKLKEKLPEGIDSKEAIALYSTDRELSELYEGFIGVLEKET